MYFDFEEFIADNRVNFTLEYPAPHIEQEYDELGNPVKATESGFLPPIPSAGALIPIEQKTVYQSGGTLTEDDRNLFTTVLDIPKKTQLRYKGMVYSVENCVPWGDYANFARYTCKAVSAFD